MKTQPIIKNDNLKAIYRAVCRNKAISRARLAKELGLSKPTISLLADELIRGKFIRESSDSGEQRTQTGRRPTYLVPREGVHLIAVAHWKSEGRWIDFINAGTGTFVEHVMIADTTGNGCADCSLLPELTRRAFDEACARRAATQKKPKERIIGLCIVLEGMLDPERRRFVSTPLGISWKEGEKILSETERLFRDLRVGIFVDTACTGYGEMITQHLEERDFAYINMGEGIGASLVLHGKMLGGASGAATQLGHICLDPDGPRCRCGGNGCFEALSGEYALYDRYREKMPPEYRENLTRLTYADIARHAEMGEQWADEAISEIADNFAKAVRNLITLFCPELIIIGGDVTILGQRFMDRVEENLNRLDYLFMASKVKTVLGGPTDLLVDIGAAGYMTDHYISLADPYQPGLHIG